MTSCKKTEIANPSVAAGQLNVTNAVVGGSTITMTSNNNIISTSNTVGDNGWATFPLAGGQIKIDLSVPAIAATATSAAIPEVPYYNGTFSVNNNSNYSLFLSGLSINAIDNVLIKESYPFAYADSVCGVRCINLAPDTNPISVDIQGNANGSEVASLAYKAYSGFNQHPAKAVNSSYTFEFRDAASGTLLASYTLTTPYFHNVTLCLSGSGGSYGVIQDNDF
jgi:hypothetical protein